MKNYSAIEVKVCVRKLRLLTESAEPSCIPIPVRADSNMALTLRPLGAVPRSASLVQRGATMQEGVITQDQLPEAGAADAVPSTELDIVEVPADKLPDFALLMQTEYE